MHLKFRLLLFISFCANMSWSQNYFGIELSKIQFDSVALVQLGVKSIHVYNENIQDASYQYQKPANYVMTTKRMEVEINESGQVKYQRFIDPTERSYGLGDKTTTHLLYNYYPDGKVKSLCELERWSDMCTEFTYDDEGHIVSIYNSGDRVINETYTFNWRDGKMIESSNTSERDEDYKSTRFFDDKGRISKVEFSNSSFEYRYAERGNVLRTEIIMSSKDSITSRVINEKLVGLDRITYNLSLRGDGDTLSVLKLKYDEYGNPIEVYNADYSNRYRYPYNQKPIPPVIIESPNEQIVVERELPEPLIRNLKISNVYENELLIKRTIQEVSDDDEKMYAIERVIYESEPLPLHSWPLELEEGNGEYYEDGY